MERGVSCITVLRVESTGTRSLLPIPRKNNQPVALLIYIAGDCVVQQLFIGSADVQVFRHVRNINPGVSRSLVQANHTYEPVRIRQSLGLAQISFPRPA